uniref:Uncharacterized protein n=1 Tax=Picea glauca TaxID=3330 RepID=A0A101M2J9_PICGL|nr:hypothetical protein ABT39_MTgene3088 [Picea glauca]QHR87185.1 hypothetical protein Q903MT_gene1194 [Picea sitchensis]
MRNLALTTLMTDTCLHPLNYTYLRNLPPYSHIQFDMVSSQPDAPAPLGGTNFPSWTSTRRLNRIQTCLKWFYRRCRGRSEPVWGRIWCLAYFVCVWIFTSIM